MKPAATSEGLGSLAVAVRLSKIPFGQSRGTATNEGVGDKLRTPIRTSWVAVRVGSSVSVTRTVATADTGPSGGVQVKTPLVGSMCAPAGDDWSRLNVTGSPPVAVAVAVNVNRLPSSTV